MLTLREVGAGIAIGGRYRPSPWSKSLKSARWWSTYSTLEHNAWCGGQPEPIPLPKEPKRTSSTSTRPLRRCSGIFRSRQNPSLTENSLGPASLQYVLTEGFSGGFILRMAGQRKAWTITAALSVLLNQPPATAPRE